VIGQAQNAASAAVGAVSGLASSVAGLALGGGSKVGDTKEDEAKKPEDPRVDQVPDENVEQFVRAQYPSTTATKAAQ
jgi:hypothetical protein